MKLNRMLCTLGKFDIPIIQLQPPFMVDLLDSNIALFGASMSGKTTFIKTLVNILHKQYDERQEQIFILDFGGSLSEYKDFPLISAYFDNSNEEYVKRVFKILEQHLNDNIKLLRGNNFRDSDIQPKHTTFIIDNLNAFFDEPRYTAYQEKFSKLCRDGLSKGITIVVSIADTKGVISHLGGFKQKIAFEMPQDKYAEIFNGKVGLIGNNPGHGFANVTIKPKGVTGTFQMNLPYEVQCTYPYKDELKTGKVNSQQSFNEALKRKFAYEHDVYTKCVKKYQTFPDELTRQAFNQLTSNDEVIPNMLRVGLDYVDFKEVGVHIDKTHMIAIYGKKEFGKTNLLNLLIDDLLRWKPDARFVLFDDGRNQLKSIYERIHNHVDTVLFHQYMEVEIAYKDGTALTRKLSPLQQFYKYINEQYSRIEKSLLSHIYKLNNDTSREINSKIPDCYDGVQPFTIFIIQSKSVYINDREKKGLIESILPQMLDDAEERGYLFIFSDVQKIDSDMSSAFKNVINIAFLLDNIAEFAGERGQRSIFGDMDYKALKEEYARCVIGDGYVYDVEGDQLKKLKFIKYGEEDDCGTRD